MKKGQVTAYIIIGLAILLVVAIFLFARTDIIRNQLPVSEQVPLEFDPVKTFVEGCLEQTAIQGLETLGERGGFINPGQYGFITSSEVTQGNAIAMANNWMVPLWWYLKSDNQCSGGCEFSVVPEAKLHLYKNAGMPSIEGQLEDYVNQHLTDCINDFRELGRQGFSVTEDGQPQASVLILDNSISFGLTYPISAKKISTREITQFASEVDVNLKDMYELAVLLTNLEAAYHYLEVYALDMIVALSAPQEDKLPPMAETTFNFGNYPHWSKSKVQSQISGLLSSYISLLKVYGTANFEEFYFPGDPFRTGFYNGGMVLPGNATFANLAVSFDYLGWQPYFDLNCKGDDCVPDSISTQIIQLFGIQRYNFLYDLSYPVLITLTDPDAIAFGSKGYSFTFALEANVRDNQAMKSNYVPVKVADASASSLVCGKKVSGEVTVKITDSLTKEPVSDAAVIYSCAGESCSIGETDEVGSLVSKFPICFNGIVSYIKEGYVGSSYILTTDDQKAVSSITLNPVVTKRFTVKKALMEKTASGYTAIPSSIGNPMDLDDNERAIIYLNKKIGPNEQPYSTYAEFSGGMAEISLAPGEYDMRIDLYYYGNFTIPARTEVIAGETVSYPAIAFNQSNPFPNGGLHCEGENSIRTSFVASNPGFGKEVIVFKALSPNLPFADEVRIEDLSEIGNVDSYAQYCYALTPEHADQ
ncbi:MAG TPA: hypothetical protein VJH97_06370 [Candidatus Nanoarchaeia archaeon]|nr:hypothetical protein [Candidatus Nanoarchaeia archaeon]